MSITGVVFCLAFTAGCLLALTRRPVYGAITYIATFFLSPPLRWWGQGALLPIRWSLIAAAVTVIAILIHRRPASMPAKARHSVLPTFLVFILWLVIESTWSLSSAAQSEFISYYIKFAIAIWLVHKCADSEQNIRLIMWTYVLGCFYFGWIAYSSYQGGRFEDFGGADINEANAAALTLVTGIFLASALFLEGGKFQKGLLIAMIPFIVNAVVTTISRSGFLAVAIGGLVFNWFAPAKFRIRVLVSSVLAVILFLMLTGPTYWNRIETIEDAGANIQGVDTGSGRLVLLEAQWRMFRDHPMGCGASCTAVLSPQYLAEQYLAGGERASHNTFMTMLVEHGIPGVLFYVLLLIWMFYVLRRLSRAVKQSEGFLPTLYPAIAAVVAALTVGDLFVTYSKLEVRFWFVALLMAMSDLAQQKSAVTQERLGKGELALEGAQPGVQRT